MTKVTALTVIKTASVLIVAALVAGMLASCATQTPQQATLTGCQTFAKSLRVLSAARYQGRLTPAQIDTVDQLIGVAYPVCTAPEPPANGAAIVGSVNNTLEAIIFSMPPEKNS